MGSHRIDLGFSYYSVSIVPCKVSEAAMNMVGYLRCQVWQGAKSKKGSGDIGGTSSKGAVDACRLAVQGMDGESGTFTNKDGLRSL